MSNDIQFEKNGIIFNYRVGILLRNKNKILVQKDNRVKHLTLPGGKCCLLESSVTTAIREFKEETGLDTKFIKNIGIIENFFTSKFNSKQYHEILIINELELINKDFYNLNIIKNIEIKNDKNLHLTYVWMTINDLNKLEFQPKILLDMLDKDKFHHFVNEK